MTAPPAPSRDLLPFGYLIAAVVGVVGWTYLLATDASKSLGAILRASLGGLGFVAATAALLYLLQSRWRPVRFPAWLPAPVGRAEIRPYLIFAIAVLGVLLAGHALYTQQSTEVTRRAGTTLSSLNELTADRIEDWIEDCRVDLEFAGRNPLLAYAIVNRRESSADLARPDMQGGLDILRESEGFERVQVFASDGAAIGHAGGAIARTERLQYWIRGAELTGRVVMSDLYVPADSTDGKPVIDFVVSVINGSSKVAGVLVARADPDKYVFPTVTRQGFSDTPRSFVIAHRRGDAVAVLMPPALRSAKEFEWVTATADSAAVQVVRGRDGVFAALDEQGRRVLATGHPIANTPWHLVGTVSEDDVFAPLRRATKFIVALVVAALALAAWFVATWWRSERRALAERLDAAERRTSVVKEHFTIAGRFVHDIVLLLDERDATIVEANDRALVAYGYAREELLARTIFDLRPAGSAEQALARERFETMRATDGGSFVTRHWRKDGRSFPIEISARFCSLGGRQFVQLVGRDVSERIEQEERVSRISADRDRVLERMHRQFDQMAAACIVLSAEGNVLQVNPAYVRVFGHAPAQIVGLNIDNFIRSVPFREQVHRWLEHLRGDPDATLAGIFENTDARRNAIHCRWTATALRDDAGRFAGLIGMAEDITERIEAERALRNSEERYRTLTHISPVGIFRTDLAGLTVFVNSRCSQIVGLPAQECLGLGWVRSIHAQDAPATGQAWQAYIESQGTLRYEQEFRFKRADGRTVWVLAQCNPERDLQGELQGHIGTMTDVTALKAAQFELRQAHDHLEERVAERTVELEHAKNAAEQSDRVKSAFLSTMSHELRTPLNSILGFTDVLLQGLSGPLTAPQQRQLQIVRDSSTHLRALIEDVLDISRIEAGQVGLEFAEIDLADVVRRRVEAFGPEYAHKGLALKVETEGLVPLIRSDGKRAAQIVNNLLSNALKFTARGSVTVRLRRALDRLEIAVIDTGIGIPGHALGDLFDPFTQVARPGGRMHEGTGLGLAISRSLARALGGDITVVSEVDRGSRFEFWLPLVPTEFDVASVSGTFRKADVRRTLGAV